MNLFMSSAMRYIRHPLSRERLRCKTNAAVDREQMPTDLKHKMRGWQPTASLPFFS